ncbi:arif-1 protein [Thysanoplusia orichalcea nucleopolyhedrovirus]|uniref:Arif-1 protein n=1 Tax=Thysanoplusia orichalcea nucleopolyhedrovirus TaxID=101850 RepID=L0CL49_9ABAC|nr:arif-1 protein [Thysanoplusia orichalcea nucleopolyhedrovirus]AGA16175.1 arif-1 protein [Thysanoplusia orichalcea nucleopolyhedrovirus]
MLNKISAVLQLGLNASLLLVYFTVFVLSVMGVINNRYAFLLEIEKSQSVINLSIPIMLTFGMYIFFYMFYFIWKIIVWASNRRNQAVNLNQEDNFYITITLILLNTVTGLCWMLFVMFQIYVFKNGHLPALDVLYRHYDLESVCWDSIVYTEIDYTSHDEIDPNCVYINLYKKCIMCRATVSYNEPTVFNENYPVIIMGVLTLLAVQCWNLYVQLKEMRQNIYQKRRAEAERASYEHYCDLDYCREERDSNSRLLEVVSEGRNSGSLAAAQPASSAAASTAASETLSSFIAHSDASSQPTSPFGVHNEFCFGDTYTVSQPIYSVPKKAVCASPDACTMCTPPPDEEEVIRSRTPTVSPKLFRKSRDPSPIKPVRAPTPPPLTFNSELQRKFQEKKLLPIYKD